MKRKDQSIPDLILDGRKLERLPQVYFTEMGIHYNRPTILSRIGELELKGHMVPLAACNKMSKETVPTLGSTHACISQKHSFRIQIMHGVITNITTNHIIYV